MKNFTSREQDFLQKTSNAPQQWSKPQMTKVSLDQALAGATGVADGATKGAGTAS